MRYLLDTHVWLWMATTPERLGPGATAIVADDGAELLLSAASSWEIAIKYGLGRLPLPMPPSQYVPDRMRLLNVGRLAVEHVHALRVALLPLHHRDPFDRMLVAQAQIEDLTIITADRLFHDYDVAIEPAG